MIVDRNEEAGIFSSAQPTGFFVKSFCFFTNLLYLHQEQHLEKLSPVKLFVKACKNLEQHVLVHFQYNVFERVFLNYF